MKSKKIALGITVFAAVGTLVGLLFTTDKGSKMRKDMLHKGEDYVDVLKEKVEDLMNNISKKTENIKQEAVDLVKLSK
jgi:gas vesicle protein